MNKYWLCTSLLSTRNSQHHLFRTMGNHHGLKELLRRRTVTRKEGSSERFRSRRRSREKNGIIGINTWEWFYAIRSETKRLVCHFNPWLWKERNYPSHIHPDHPFTLSPFITLIRTGLTDPVCTVVHERSTAMWGLGLRAGGMERKETDSIKT